MYDLVLHLQSHYGSPNRPLQTPLRTPKSVRRGVEPRNPCERVIGTPDYLAPEILRGEEHGIHVDYILNFLLGILTCITFCTCFLLLF